MLTLAIVATSVSATISASQPTSGRQSRTIQRILAVFDPQKSRSLLECFFAEAFDLPKLDS